MTYAVLRQLARIRDTAALVAVSALLCACSEGNPTSVVLTPQNIPAPLDDDNDVRDSTSLPVTFEYPVDGQILDLGGGYLSRTNAVDGATFYYTRMTQTQTNESGHTTRVSAGQYGQEFRLWPNDPDYAKFKNNEKTTLRTWAWVNNDWHPSPAISIELLPKGPVKGYVVIPVDRKGDFQNPDAFEDFKQFLATDIRNWYFSRVGRTYRYLDTRIIYTDKRNEWLWCRPEDVNPAGIGCAENNYEHNILQVLQDETGEDFSSTENSFRVILGIGGGGWAGARLKRAIVGEASLVAYRFGCGNVSLAFPGDTVRDTCFANDWANYGTAAGTVAHELGHAFGLPHSSHVSNSCEESIMTYHTCFPEAGLNPQEVERLFKVFR